MSETESDTTPDGTAADEQATATQLVVGPVAAPLAPRQRDASVRSGSATWLEERSPTLLAVALSAPALVLPFGWLLLCLLLAWIAGSVKRSPSADGARGPADLVVPPLRTLGAAANPANLVLALAGVAAAIAGGAAIAAAWGLVTWLPSEGSTGLLAAVRLAVLAYGPRLAVAMLCFLLLRRQLGAGMHGAGVRTRARAISEEALTGMTITGGIVVLASLVLASSSWWPAGSTAGAIGLLPSALETQLRDGQASLVEDEAHAVSDCVAQHDRGWSWRVGSAARLPDGSFGIAVRTSQKPFRRDVAVLVMALQNQLAPWVSSVRVVTPGLAVRLDRRKLGHGAPVGSVGELVHAANLPAGALGAERDVRAVALRCSAAAV
jgi:hypothetical protein